MNDQKQIDQMAAEARRKYQREWRARNKDRVRASNRKYWERRAMRMAEKEAEA